MIENKLYYVHDPMCSWCWGFRPKWDEIREAIDNLFVGRLSCEYLLGGLAPDSDEIMPVETQEYVKANWSKIETVIPGVAFNYDFWSQCQPRRSTYPSCRATIVAKRFGPQYQEPMIHAIQIAYYLEAQNPSNADVLQQCAEKIGIDGEAFGLLLQSSETEKQLQAQILQYHQLAAKGVVAGFPSLALSIIESTEDGASVTEHWYSVPIDYNDATVTMDFLQKMLS